MRRGAARLLILKVLCEGPRHGYAVAQDVSKMFGRDYEPSPGLVYPTLQWLEDGEYVRGAREGGKIVYAITPGGRDFLADHRAELDGVLDSARKWSATRARPLARSAARLERTVLLYLPEMSEARRAAVARILDDARACVTRLMEDA